MKQVMEGLPMEAVSLLNVFASLPDPRAASGLRHPLPALLVQATAAMLAGARSLEAIAQFGRDRGEAFAQAVAEKDPNNQAQIKRMLDDLEKLFGKYKMAEDEFWKAMQKGK